MNMHTTELHTEIDLLITEYISGNLSQDSFEKLRQWSLKSEENRCYSYIMRYYSRSFCHIIYG